MEIDLIDSANLGTVIKVVGVGGAGGNAVQHMINRGVSGVEFIAANTDAQALKQSKAHNIIQIGESGLGAGMKPNVGRQLAEETRSRIEDALRGAHMVFIAAGMGGGTGTGAAPIVAQVAKEQGALTVAVVSKPFSYEGQKCMEIAEEGLEELGKHVDSLIVILNEKLEEIYEDDSMIEWLQHADDVLNNAVAGIAEIINVPGHINVDFNDVKTIMGEQGKAMMGTATASGVDRARIAAEQAVASPLLDGIDLSGARGVLVNVTASRSLKGKEIKEVMATVRAFAAPDASIAQGIAYDDAMGDEIRVTVVATGLGRSRKGVQLVQTPVLRTGTHNEPVMAASKPVGGAPQAGSFEGLKQPAVWRRDAGSHIRSFNSSGMVAIKDKEVTPTDVARVIETAKAVNIPTDQQLLHTVPQEFIVDSQEDVREPIGMSGIRLEVKVHIVTGAVSAVQNIVKCVRRCGLEVSDLILQPMASADAVLTSDEKELGVVLVDIGGGTTDIAIFSEGAIRHTAVIPIAGDQITNDIAMALRTPTMEAEEVKLRFGVAKQVLVDPGETLEVPGLGDRGSRTLSRQALAAVIEPRVEELFSLVHQVVRESGYEEVLSSGIVLTGGSAMMPGMVELAEDIFLKPARLGTPEYSGQLADVIRSPRYSTVLGLLREAKRQYLRGQIVQRQEGSVTAIWQRMKEWFLGNF